MSDDQKKENVTLGRPPNTPEIEIDETKVYKYAAIGCSVVEIAKIMGCSTDTLHRRFQKQIDMGRGNLILRVRSVLLDEGLTNRSPAALKDVANRYLGNVDSPLVELNLNETAPKLVIEFIDPHEPKKEESIDANFQHVREEKDYLDEN